MLAGSQRMRWGAGTLQSIERNSGYELGILLRNYHFAPIRHRKA
ncbi:MAG: hypothetical protein ACOVS5_00010 [Oligoflexus sp.]